jgi:hypothetical protein
MKIIALSLMAVVLLGSGPVVAKSRCADLSLVLAIDSSSSIDDDEFRMQVLGYAAAFTNPDVLRALRDAGTVDVATVFWADSGAPTQIIPWVRINGQEDVRRFADNFLIKRRDAFGDTDLGNGLMTALDLIDEPGRCSARAVVNVSGDGRATLGDRRKPLATVAEARARAEAMGVTVNALAIVNAEQGLAEYYRTQLITGPGAFVMEAQDFRAFGDSIVQKLEREIRPQLSASADQNILR